MTAKYARLAHAPAAGPLHNPDPAVIRLRGLYGGFSGLPAELYGAERTACRQGYATPRHGQPRAGTPSSLFHLKALDRADAVPPSLAGACDSS